jgi:hypothetical protein
MQRVDVVPDGTSPVHHVPESIVAQVTSSAIALAMSPPSISVKYRVSVRLVSSSDIRPPLAAAIFYGA